MRHTQFSIGILGLVLAMGAEAATQRTIENDQTTELEDFVVYAQPEVIDALRNRPFTKRDPVIEAFFEALPSITRATYEENLSAMRSFLSECQQDKTRKLQHLAETAGLNTPPQSLVEGYEERIEILETILDWVTREMPIQLIRLDVWKESELRSRLARSPVPNMRINPETEEIESRLLFNWTLIDKPRPRSKSLKLDFAMGIQLQEKTGFYNPSGFLHWSEISRRNLQKFEISYPVIITERLNQNLKEELPAYLEAYKTTLDSFYHILREFFFSDLADIHTLYVLTRGRIISDEWHQYQATALLRGLAAYLVFNSLESDLGKEEVLRLQEEDWTTWHLRRIGSRYNAITWEGEREPYFGYGSYKQFPDLQNIYWSTKFVQYLVETYGDGFVPEMCKRLASGNRKLPQTDKALFKEITGDDLETVTKIFLALHRDS
jgi:hypothetical protein